MLKANAIGRFTGFGNFKEALNYVALTITTIQRGKKAQKPCSGTIASSWSPKFSL